MIAVMVVAVVAFSIGVVYLVYQFRSRAAHQSNIKDAFYKYVSIDWKTPAEAVMRNIIATSVF